MLKLSGYEIFKNQIVTSKYDLDLVLEFRVETRGWIRFIAKKSTWSYNSRERRWAYGLKPSEDIAVMDAITAMIADN